MVYVRSSFKGDPEVPTESGLGSITKNPAQNGRFLAHECSAARFFCSCSVPAARRGGIGTTSTSDVELKRATQRCSPLGGASEWVSGATGTHENPVWGVSVPKGQPPP